MLAVIIFIAILGLIVFVHELGHFLVAKRAGMRVDEFGFGFPPRIFGIKKGGTVYSINWIPLGGFVKIKGENGDEAEDGDSFGAKSLPRRIAVILAGVTMNVVLAIVLFTGGYLFGVPQAVDTVPPGAIVSERTVRISGLLSGSPAEKAGIMPGDVVVSADGQAVSDSTSLRKAIQGSTGEMKITVMRDKAAKDIAVAPETLKDTGTRGIGVELIDVGTIRYPWYLAPIKGVETSIQALGAIFVSFYGLFVGLFSGAGLSPDVSGPVGIAVITNEAVKIGFRYLIEFTALLSLNLAVVNVIPFPALDGGRFLFLVIEAIRGRAVSRRIEGWSHQIGFILLMLMILAVTYRDLVRYGGAIGGFFRGIF